MPSPIGSGDQPGPLITKTLFTAVSGCLSGQTMIIMAPNVLPKNKKTKQKTKNNLEKRRRKANKNLENLSLLPNIT